MPALVRAARDGARLRRRDAVLPADVAALVREERHPGAPATRFTSSPRGGAAARLTAWRPVRAAAATAATSAPNPRQRLARRRHVDPGVVADAGVRVLRGVLSLDHDAESVHGVLQAAGHAYLRGVSWSSVEVRRGGAAATTWILRGGGSRWRRSHDVDNPRRRVRGGAAATTWIFR